MDSNSGGRSIPRIGITIGDINGIGPEIIMKVFSDNRILKMATPIIYGSSKTFSYYKKHLGHQDFNFNQTKDSSEVSEKKVNLLNCWEEAVEINVGKSTDNGGRCARIALERSAQDLEAGSIDAVVTAPINKANIQSDAFKHSGHTEFFENKFGQNSTSLMMMVSDDIKLGLVTAHIPLINVASSINKESIEGKLTILMNSLKNDFDIQKPKIAVLGLNPHSGEEGLLGSEEIETISPVINEQKNNGHLVFGPFPGDGFFGSSEFTKYDGILAMYHDQGLIPFKSISFSRGVNYTAGLSIIRTSPDHGTAYSIAGKNIANENSLREAIYLAIDIYKKRLERKNFSNSE